MALLGDTSGGDSWWNAHVDLAGVPPDAARPAAASWAQRAGMPAEEAQAAFSQPFGVCTEMHVNATVQAFPKEYEQGLLLFHDPTSE
eukprot:2667232-Lingulodinium_polyedra.AAC.1